jgi:hypothetical protein
MEGAATLSADRAATQVAPRGSEGGPVTLPVFKTGDWQLRCQWCVRLAHASAKIIASDLPFRSGITAIGECGISRSLAGLRCLAAAWPIQNCCCAGIHQQGEAIAKVISFGVDIDQNGAIAADAASQNASQAEQRAAAAHLASFSSAVADDFAVGAKDSFQKWNGGQNWFIPLSVGHGSLFQASRLRTTREVPD